MPASNNINAKAISKRMVPEDLNSAESNPDAVMQNPNKISNRTSGIFVDSKNALKTCAMKIIIPINSNIVSVLTISNLH